MSMRTKPHGQNGTIKVFDETIAAHRNDGASSNTKSGQATPRQPFGDASNRKQVRPTGGKGKSRRGRISSQIPVDDARASATVVGSIGKAKNAIVGNAESIPSLDHQVTKGVDGTNNNDRQGELPANRSSKRTKYVTCDLEGYDPIARDTENAKWVLVCPSCLSTRALEYDEVRSCEKCGLPSQYKSGGSGCVPKEWLDIRKKEIEIREALFTKFEQEEETEQNFPQNEELFDVKEKDIKIREALFIKLEQDTETKQNFPNIPEKKALKSMQQKLDQAESKATRANVKAESLETNNTGLAKKLNVAFEENTKLKEQLKNTTETKEMEVCHLESRLSSSEKINALNHSLFEAQKENMEAKVTQAEAKAAEANVKAESLETENTALAEKLNAAGEENTKLKEQLKKITEAKEMEIRHLESELSSSKEIKALNHSLLGVQQEEMKNKIIKLENEIRQAQEARAKSRDIRGEGAKRGWEKRKKQQASKALLQSAEERANEERKARDIRSDRTKRGGDKKRNQQVYQDEGGAEEDAADRDAPVAPGGGGGSDAFLAPVASSSATAAEKGKPGRGPCIFRGANPPTMARVPPPRAAKKKNKST